MLGLLVGVAGAAAWLWRDSASACFAPAVTFSTDQRCFRERATPLARHLPLTGCVGGRATYRATAETDDELAWEAVECLSEAARAQIQEELTAYLDGEGYVPEPTGLTWSDDARRVRLKLRGVVGGPVAVQVLIQELESAAP